jgi:AbrB family looped-hinge helix DNA binding protein
MHTATLTSKGQVTIPLALRTALGLQAGSKLDFVQQGDGFKVVPLRMAAASLNGRFAGRVKQPISLAAMDDAIATEVAQAQLAVRNNDRA